MTKRSSIINKIPDSKKIIREAVEHGIGLIFHNFNSFWGKEIIDAKRRRIADINNPRSKPPGPSEIQPTRVGPTICPAANAAVKALIPDDHADCGKLCLTSAVVDATTDKKMPPNPIPEKRTADMFNDKTGSKQNNERRKFRIARDCPPLNLSNIGDQTLDDAITERPSNE